VLHCIRAFLKIAGHQAMSFAALCSYTNEPGHSNFHGHYGLRNVEQQFDVERRHDHTSGCQGANHARGSLDSLTEPGRSSPPRMCCNTRLFTDKLKE
jgi:hypothetical protein